MAGIHASGPAFQEMIMEKDRQIDELTERVEALERLAKEELR